MPPKPLATRLRPTKMPRGDKSAPVASLSQASARKLASCAAVIVSVGSCVNGRITMKEDFPLDTAVEIRLADDCTMFAACIRP